MLFWKRAKNELRAAFPLGLTSTALHDGGDDDDHDDDDAAARSGARSGPLWADNCQLQVTQTMGGRKGRSTAEASCLLHLKAPPNGVYFMDNKLFRL